MTTVDPRADTGRLKRGLRARTSRMVFGSTPAQRTEELRLISRIDLAHIVMLHRQGLLGTPSATALLRCVRTLRDNDFVELWEVPAPRGVYLMYEGHLAARLGEAVGGALHTGRSRNDMKATMTALRVRSWLADFLSEAVRLEAILLGRARAHQDVVMPVYTHFQPAMPITYGHYLLGVAIALGRDVDAVLAAADGLGQCPMGAGAVAGTDLPLDPELVADLLGFDRGPAHAIDAVASRDVLLRLLAAVTGIGITLSRLATDLQLWTSAEFGMLGLPDHLVGGSSAMPQKRNAFLLEHLKAKAGAAIGAWTAAASMTKSTPFTNTIEVGTEAVEACWPGLRAVSDAVLFGQVLVGGAKPEPARMRDRAADGFTVATAYANKMVLDGVPFRTAHHVVGAAVRDALDRGESTLDGSGIDVETAMSSTSVGGGPGAFPSTFTEAHHAAIVRAAQCRARRDRLTAADDRLADAVHRILRDTRGDSGTP